MNKPRKETREAILETIELENDPNAKTYTLDEALAELKSDCLD